MPPKALLRSRGIFWFIDALMQTRALHPRMTTTSYFSGTLTLIHIHHPDEGGVGLLTIDLLPRSRRRNRKGIFIGNWDAGGANKNRKRIVDVINSFMVIYWRQANVLNAHFNPIFPVISSFSAIRQPPPPPPPPLCNAMRFAIVSKASDSFWLCRVDDKTTHGYCQIPIL